MSVNDASVNVVRCTRARMRQSTGTFFVGIVAPVWQPLRTPRFPHPSAILMGDYISPLMMVRNAEIPAARSDEPWSRYAIFIEIAKTRTTYTCVHVITLAVPKYVGHEMLIADALKEVYPDIRWAVTHASLLRVRYF